MRVIRTRYKKRGREDQKEETQPIGEVNKQLNKRMSEAFPLKQSVPTYVSE